MADELRPDIALLDLVLPDLDGIEVMRHCASHARYRYLLTGLGSATDKARGLDLGADDYVAQPFHPDQLAARVRAFSGRGHSARRARGRSSPRLRDRRREAPGQARERDRASEPDRMDAPPAPRTERRQGRPPFRAAHQVWGPAYRDDLQYLRVWVSRVRRKLGAARGQQGPIITYPGIGYSLVADEDPRPKQGLLPGGPRKSPPG